MPKHALVDYSDIQSVLFCACGCPLEVKTTEMTLRPLEFQASPPGQGMPACPFCYRIEEFGLPGDQLLPLPLLPAKTQARVLAEGLRAEGIRGAGGWWKRGE